MKATITYNDDDDSRFHVAINVDSVECQELISDILEDSRWSYSLSSWNGIHTVNTDAPIEEIAEMLAVVNRVFPGTIEIDEDL